MATMEPGLKRRRDAPVIELAPAARQAVADDAQGVRMRQLAEQHGGQQRPAREPLGVTVPLVLADQGVKPVAWNLLKQLTEKTG